MTKTETVNPYHLVTGTVMADGFQVTRSPMGMTMKGQSYLIVTGHWGNNVLTSRKFHANALVSVVPSC
jgi:hypothetical protein